MGKHRPYLESKTKGLPSLSGNVGIQNLFKEGLSHRPFTFLEWKVQRIGPS